MREKLGSGEKLWHFLGDDQEKISAWVHALRDYSFRSHSFHISSKEQLLINTLKVMDE